MGSKTLTLATLAASQREKGAKARARRVQKRKKTSPAKWLGKEWAARYRRDFPGTEVEWTGAEAALAKRLIDERGFDGALAMIGHFFDTWNRRKASRSGTPGLRLLWVMRGQLAAEMEGKVKVPELREQKINSGEWTEGVEEANPTQGWGDWDEEDLGAYEDSGDGW